MRIYYIGAPGPCGGANTEMASTIKLWRRHGVEVTVIPTWSISTDGRTALEALGCQVHVVGVPPAGVPALAGLGAGVPALAGLGDIPGLRGAVVHSMTNSHFWKIYPKLKEWGCRTIWSNSMTFLFPEELLAFRQHGLPDAFHFQSDFQKTELEKLLLPLGYTHDRGALDPRGLRFRRDSVSSLLASRGHQASRRRQPRVEPTQPPSQTAETHVSGSPTHAFTIGRLSRPDQDKWSATTGPSWPACPTRPAGLVHGLDRADAAEVRSAAALGRSPGTAAGSRWPISSPAATRCSG